MRERRGAAFRRPAARVVLVALVLVLAHRAADPFLEFARGKSYDLTQRFAPATPPAAGVVIVGIDDATLAREGRWPWPRERIADLIRRIDALEPAALGIDILFPDEGDAAGDQALAEAIAAARPVLATSIADTAGPALPAPVAGWSVIGDAGAGFPALASLLAPRAAYAARAGGLGVVRSVADGDGVTRSVPMVWAVANQDGVSFWPSMALDLARTALDAPGYALRLSSSGYDAVKIGDRIVPLTSGGAIWLADTTAPVPRVSALDVFDGRAGAAVSGRIALLSVTATGFDTFHATPLAATRPGADIHALITRQILDGPFPHEPAAAKSVERAGFLALALLMAAAIAFLAERRALLVPVLAAIAVSPFGFGLLAYIVRGEFYDTLQPAAGLVFLAGCGTYFLYRAAEARRQRIGEQFARYLAPRVVEKLVRTDADVSLAAERRIVTVLFMDMRDFTAASERLPPDEVVATVNRFLTLASEEIFRADGTIDKFMGDAVMAFWNAPLEQPDHAARALGAMRGFVRRLAVENDMRRERGLEAIRVGIGVETGPCSVGNFGSDLRYNFTVIGQAANMAARLEAATRTAGTIALAGPGFAGRVPDSVAPAGRLTLAGFAEPVQAYAVDLA